MSETKNEISVQNLIKTSLRQCETFIKQRNVKPSIIHHSLTTCTTPKCVFVKKTNLSEYKTIILQKNLSLSAAELPTDLVHLIFHTENSLIYMY